MIILGSGGHTAEMLNYLETMDLSKFHPRCYLVANTDIGVNGSENKAHSFERARGQTDTSDYSIRRIYRSREVGQSYFTSIFTTLWALIQSIVMMAQEMPDLIICNGPGTCVPPCLISFLFRVLGLKNIKLIFSESLTCIDNISLTGKILYPISHRFFVQWENLAKKGSKAQYTGRFGKSRSTTFDNLKNPRFSRLHEGHLLVIVGSTSFDELIRELDREDMIPLLKKLGFSGVHLQIGRGNYIPQRAHEDNPTKSPTSSPISRRFNSSPRKRSETFSEAIYYRFVESLQEEMKNASMVISHAGAGSILECLSLGKPLIVVPNERLMNNHQLQLAKQLGNMNFLLYTRVQDLREKLEDIANHKDELQLNPFPQSESFLFKNYVMQEMGFNQEIS